MHILDHLGIYFDAMVSKVEVFLGGHNDMKKSSS